MLILVPPKLAALLQSSEGEIGLEIERHKTEWSVILTTAYPPEWTGDEYISHADSLALAFHEIEKELP